MRTFSLLVMVFFIALGCVHKKSSAPNTSELCDGKATCPAKTKLFQECIQVTGAVWKSETGVCVKPINLAACQRAGKNLVWDGIACVTEDTPLNFYRACLTTTLESVIQQTFSVMSQDYTKTSCQDAYNKLSAQTSLSYPEAEIVDLTLFQSLTNLEELNLWNNQIFDLRPLVNLKKLKILNLGHNQVIDVLPLSFLENLQSLMLFENQIKDVSPLAKLTNLHYLDLSSNSIQDFTSIKGLNPKGGFYIEGQKSP